MPDDRPADAPPALTQATPRPGATAQETQVRAPAPGGPVPGLPLVPGYTVQRVLGEGGMAVVYAAREVPLDRDVAIKVMKPGHSASRFVVEAQVTARLPHPNIPPVHALGTLADGRPYLVMKLVSGHTLGDVLKGAGAGDRARLLGHFEGVCQAVGFAHARGLIHRDLKPSNVMVGAFGEVQVMDWGLAKDASASEAPAAGGPRRAAATLATLAGAVKGTPAYMAPEQARGETVDARADVFALGGILATILTGRPPFAGNGVMDTVIRAAQAELADIFAHLDASGADRALVALAKRCLAPRAQDRPADGNAVAGAVARYRAKVDERLRRAERERAAAEARAAEEANTRREAEAKAVEQRRRKQAQRALAAAGVLLTLVGGFGVVIASLWRTAEGARDEALGAREAAEMARDQLGAEKVHTEAARDEAVRQKGLADASRDAESGLRALADRARAVAEQARADEAEARAAVEREGRKLEMFEYGRTVQLAHQEWRENNLLAARALLAGTKPGLRGWEWRYVHRLCHADLLTLADHEGAVNRVALSPDGKRVVTGSSKNGCRVWDASAGKALVALPESDFLALSPDGARLLTVNRDKTTTLRDAATGKELLTLQFHTGDTFGAFASGGDQVVTAGDGPSAHVWDAKTGDLIRRITLGAKPEWSTVFALSPNGSRLFGTRLGAAKVWDTTTGKEVATLKGATERVTGACFTPDGARVLLGSADGAVGTWDARSGDEVASFRTQVAGLGNVALSPDGAALAAVGGDGTAGVYDPKTGQELVTLKGHTAPVYAVAFGPSGRLVTGCIDGTAKVWDAATAPDRLTLRPGGQWVNAIALSPDGTRVAAGSRGEKTQVWDAATGKLLLALEKGADGGSVAFSPNGSKVGAVLSGAGVRVWDAATGKELLFVGHERSRPGVAFSPDGEWVASAGGEYRRAGEIKVWNATTGAERATCTGHTNTVCAVAFSPDGGRVASASHDGSCRVWSAATGKELHTLSPKAGPGPRGGEPPRSDRVFFGFGVHGPMQFVLDEPADAITSVAFSPNGSRIVTGGADWAVRVWDAATGKELLTLRGHTRGVSQVAFSPDGTRIVSASWDRSTKVWDPVTGAEVLTLRGHTHGVSSVCFARERLVTGSYDGTVSVWDAAPVRHEFRPKGPDPKPGP